MALGRAGTIALLLLIQGNAKGAMRAIALSGHGMKTLGGHAAKTNKRTAALSRTWSKLMLTMKLGALAGVLALGTIIKNLGSFEQEIQRVYAMTKGGAQELALYTSAAIQASIKYRGSATDMARALWWVASAGFKGAEAVKVMNASVALASATMSDAAQTTEILMGTLFAYGVGAKGAVHFSDVLTKTINLSLLSMEDLGTALQYIAPMAKQMGWSFEDLNAGIAVLRDQGIKASRVGTNLRGVLNQLVNPTKANVELLGKYGVSLGDIRKLMKDPIKLMELLANKHISTADAMQLFGRWAQVGGIALLRNVPLLKEYRKELSNVAGEAERTAKIALNSLYGKLENVRDSFFAITHLFFTGKGIMSGLRGEVGKLGVALGVLYDAMLGENKWAEIVEKLERRIKIIIRTGKGDLPEALRSWKKAMGVLEDYAEQRNKAWGKLGEVISTAITKGVIAAFDAIVAAAPGKGESMGGGLADGLALGFAKAIAARPWLSAILGAALGGKMAGPWGAAAGALILPVSVKMKAEEGRWPFEGTGAGSKPGKFKWPFQEMIIEGRGWKDLKKLFSVTPADAAEVTQKNTQLAKNISSGVTKEFRSWAGQTNTRARKWGNSFAIWYGRGIKQKTEAMVGPVRSAVGKIIDIIKTLDAIIGGGVSSGGRVYGSRQGGVGGTRSNTTGNQSGGGDGPADTWRNAVMSRYGFNTNVTPEKTLAAARAIKKAIGTPYVVGGSSLSGMDCCLVGETLIPGPNGVKRMDELCPGDRIWSWVDKTLETHTVTAAWQSKTQETYRLKMMGRDITASGNHPFLRVRKTRERHHRQLEGDMAAVWETGWTRLDELAPGDALIVLDEAPEQLGEDISLDLAWLVGLIVGDGHLTNKGVGVCVYGDVRERAQQIIREHFGGGGGTQSQSMGVNIANRKLHAWLTGVGVKRKPSHEKRVPHAVWGWSREAQLAFVQGYCDADGHRPGDTKHYGDMTFASSSLGLLGEVRMLLLMMGHQVTTISTNPRKHPITIKGKLVKHARPLYTFSVWMNGRKNHAKLRNQHGLRPYLDQGFAIKYVQSVTPNGIEDTYDIEVEDSHNFVANGIVVHNSGFVSWVLNRAGLLSGRYTSSTFPGALNTGKTGPVTVWGYPPPAGKRYGHAWMSILGRFFESTSPSVRRMSGNKNWSYYGVPSLGGGGYIAKTGIAEVHKGEVVSQGTQTNIFNIYGASDEQIVDMIDTRLTRIARRANLGGGVGRA